LLNWAEMWVDGKKAKEKGEPVLLLRVEIAVPIGVELPENYHKIGVDEAGRDIFASQWHSEAGNVRAEMYSLTVFLVSRGVKVLSFEEIRIRKELKKK